MSCCRSWPAIHAGLFAAFLTVWTVALLSPVPHDSAKKVLGSEYGIFLFAKTVHVSAYAFLTVLGGTATLFGRQWWWVLPGLVVHGGLTEYFQQFVGRGSRIEDVGLDAIGVAVGGFVTWAIRSYRRYRSSAAPPSPE